MPCSALAARSGDRPVVEAAIVALLAVSWLYWLAVWWMSRTFFGHAPPLATGRLPAVSILKAVKGLDAEALRTFATFCVQDYPEYEVLFGVADADDPAVSVIERVRAEHPACNVQLYVIASSTPNPKVGLLHALAQRARYPVLVATDSDVCVRADFLRRVVAPLEDPGVGMVTCPYRGTLPLTFTARLEAMHMTCAFLPGVLMARTLLGMRFALGATVALRSADLERLGGFASVADFLADDYHIGLRMARLGMGVHLSTMVLDTVLGPTSFAEQWNREVRWARTTRVSRPWHYPGLLLTYSLGWALALVGVTGGDPLSLALLVATLALRWRIAWLLAGHAGDATVRRWLPWLPVRDLLSAAVWFVGAFGTTVAWRGRHFTVSRDGRLLDAAPPATMAKQFE